MAGVSVSRKTRGTVASGGRLDKSCFDAGQGGKLKRESIFFLFSSLKKPSGTPLIRLLYEKNLTPHPGLTGWDTSHVTTVEKIFNDATSFNRDLDDWEMSSVTTFSFMFKKKRRHAEIAGFSAQVFEG